MNQKKKILLALVVIVMAVIFIHSSLPADISSQESSGLSFFIARLFSIDIDLATTIVRKTAHFLEYFVLGALLMLYARAESSGSGRRLFSKGNRISYIGVWAVGTAYAVTDEIHQMFVSGRSCEFRDVCIDAAGVAAGILIVCLVCRVRFRKSRKTGEEDPA